MIEFSLIEVGTQNVCYVSTNIAEVNQYAQDLKAQGKKTRIVRKQIVDPSAWHAREKAKFESGEYKPLPKEWTESDWWNKESATEFHFAHVATDGERVAYTPDNEFGAQDRRYVLAPSRYLAKFFTKHLTSDRIAVLANLFTTGQYKLEIGMTEADFTFAYVQKGLRNVSSSSESCMGYSADYFHMKDHPATAYAAGDLGIAFLRDPGDSTKVVARAVVWPEKKKASRCYGVDEKTRGALDALLRAEGYEINAYFEGARIKAIYPMFLNRADPPHCDPGYAIFLMPYVDGRGIYIYPNPDDDNTFLLGTDSGGKRGALGLAGSTCGWVQCRRPLRKGEIHCEKCGSPTSEAAHVLVNNRRGRRTTPMWCPSCRSVHAFQCGMTSEWASFDIPHDEVLTSPDTRVIAMIEIPEVEECYRTGEFFSIPTFGPLVTVRNENGGTENICPAFIQPTDTLV